MKPVRGVWRWIKGGLPRRSLVKYSDLRHHLISRGRRFLEQLRGREPWTRVQTRCDRVHIGSRYHGKTVCPSHITPQGIVYSFGVGRDISFDLGMIERFDVQVYAFDPTPGASEWLGSQDLPDGFHFFQCGIADYDGFAEFRPVVGEEGFTYNYSAGPIGQDARAATKGEVARLKTLADRFGHKKIDVLKMDIEGAEYAVIDDILASHVEIGQLLVEFHHRFEDDGVGRTLQALARLNAHGFKIFNISSDGLEYSLIRRADGVQPHDSGG